MINNPKNQLISQNHDPVDLRLAESYMPLCSCVAKCGLVILLHFAFPPMRAHVFCVSLLVIDRVSKAYPERIMDTNAVAWVVLCAFLMLLNNEELAATIIPRQSLPMHTTVLFALWLMGSTMHVLNWGSGTITKSKNPSMAFVSGLRAPHTPLPRNEVIACIMTAVAITMVCDTAWFGHPPPPPVVQTPATIIAGIGISTCVYVTLSSTWSYTVVLLGGVNNAGGGGRTVAKNTAVLTTTRFMVVFYVPVTFMVPWSCIIMAWMVWVCMRYQSMHSHPKKKDDHEIANLMSQLYSLEESSMVLSRNTSFVDTEQDAGEMANSPTIRAFEEAKAMMQNQEIAMMRLVL